MVLIDIYFSKLTGYSFMKEFDSYRDLFPLGSEYMAMAFNIFVAMMPMSTILIVYVGDCLLYTSVYLISIGSWLKI